MKTQGQAGPVRLVILGYGIRGRVYAAYAAAHPDAYTLAGVADPCAEIATDAGFTRWNTWQEALESGVDADAVVVALPDRLHCEATVRALEKGFHVLLEKPIGCTWEECVAIRDAQRRARRLVLTGYVLRYSPFYRRLREIIAAGTIGDLTSVHHLAAISYGKAAHAYCRGNWSVERNGTGMLVNKCTHDFDLIEWWTRGRKCTKLASFGTLFHWKRANQPKGAADRCASCPAEVRKNCAFDAYKIYYESKELRYHFADESDAAMLKMIETSPYGRCVYACGNDSVDHQTVLMEYADGLTIILEMESYSRQRNRITHFYGTKGEVIADERQIKVMPFLGDSTVVEPEQHGHHGGGDAGIMAEFARLVRSASPERYATLLADVLESHRIAFLAEESRKTGRTILP